MHGQMNRADDRCSLRGERDIDLILFRGDDRVRRLDTVGQTVDGQRDGLGEPAKAFSGDTHLDLPTVVERHSVGRLCRARISLRQREPKPRRGRCDLGHRFGLDERRGRQRETVDIRLAALEVGVGDAHPMDAVFVRGEAEERVGAELVVVLGDGSAVRVEELQAGVERRTEAGGVDLAGNGLPLAQRERPVIDIPTWENTAVDRERQFHLDRNRIAVDLLFDDLGQLADDKRRTGSRPLRGPQSAAARTKWGVGSDADFAGHVLRIILGLLRIRQRQHRSLEPDRACTADLFRRRHAGAEQLEIAGFVEEQTANAHRHRCAALPTSGEKVRRHWWVSKSGFTTKAQRTQRREKINEEPFAAAIGGHKHGYISFLLWFSFVIFVPLW